MSLGRVQPSGPRISDGLFVFRLPRRGAHRPQGSASLGPLLSPASPQPFPFSFRIHFFVPCVFLMAWLGHPEPCRRTTRAHTRTQAVSARAPLALSSVLFQQRSVLPAVTPTASRSAVPRRRPPAGPTLCAAAPAMERGVCPHQEPATSPIASVRSLITRDRGLSSPVGYSVSTSVNCKFLFVVRSPSVSSY